MRNFQQLAAGLNVTPLLHQITLNPQLWNQYTLRTAHPQSPHQQVDDMLLRFQEMPVAGQEHEVIDAHESVWYPAWSLLTEAHNLVFDLCRVVKAERIGRILISRMAPGREIAPHIDGGAHARYYSRYHIVLDSQPGCLFRCEEEQMQMRGGDVWWFDNSLTHSVVNNSAHDRLTMVVDLRTFHA